MKYAVLFAALLAIVGGFLFALANSCESYVGVTPCVVQGWSAASTGWFVALGGIAALVVSAWWNEDHKR